MFMQDFRNSNVRNRCIGVSVCWRLVLHGKSDKKDGTYEAID